MRASNDDNTISQRLWCYISRQWTLASALSTSDFREPVMSHDPDAKPSHSPGKTPGRPAGDFVSASISEAPVVLFSLSWCSYCRAMKNLLDQLGITYVLHELDTGAYRERYSTIRHQLAEASLSSTLPQLFIGRELVGGYTDAYDMYRKGTLRALLARHNVSSTLSAPP
jgi:glutaredoxin